MRMARRATRHSVGIIVISTMRAYAPKLECTLGIRGPEARSEKGMQS